MRDFPHLGPKDKPKQLEVPFNKAQLEAIFRKHDKNRDNLLSRSELREAFKELGAMIPQLRAFLGLHHADANGDGFVSDDEMKDLVNYAFRLGYIVR